MKPNKMYTTTKNDKQTSFNGFVNCDYNITDSGIVQSSKILYIVDNCPNRYWAKKSANAMLSHFYNMYGVLDCRVNEPMLKVQRLPFSDLSFALGYDAHK